MAIALRVALLCLVPVWLPSCAGFAPGHVPEAKSSEPTRASATPLPTPAPRDAERAIRRVAVRPKTWIRNSTDPIRFEFTLPEPARVRLEVMHESGSLVHVLRVGARPGGDTQLLWDGRGPDASVLPAGVYLYRLVALTDSGREITSINPPFGGGDEVMAQRLTFDEEAGRIEFALPVPSRVRLRTGLQQFPLLATPMDWVPLEAGRHAFEWNGLDASGQVRVGSHPRVRLNVSAFGLPTNSVILMDPPEGERAFATGGRRTADYRGARYLHAGHHAAICHEPRFQVSFPGASLDPAGLPVLAGRSPVRITLHPDDRAHLIDTRFEAMFFVDNQFLFEREDGSSPFTYYVDVDPLAPGPHLLTVNILAYDDHYGVQSLRFVRKEG